MKNILTYLEENVQNKNAVKGIFIGINCFFSAVIGFLGWGVVKLVSGGNIIGLVCAVGYLVCFAGILGSVLYLMHRDLW